MPVRTIRITNVYELYDTVDVETTVDLPERASFEGSDEEFAEHVREDVLWPLTGTGRTDGNSAYFIESIDGLEPHIDEEWC